MKKYAKIMLKLIPFAFIALFIILCLPYGAKKAGKIILPSMFSVVTAIGINCLIFGEINLFSVISIFLLVGFTIDYSIFRSNKEKNTEDAVFVSCITTSSSFLLLSFCGFKLLSSIAVVLFFGIITSYFAGKILFLHDRI